jgi:hypothetical protein
LAEFGLDGGEGALKLVVLGEEAFDHADSELDEANGS